MSAFALEASGLDVSLGLMHGVVYGRKSLALDLMELFRVETVDRLVLRLSNWGMIGMRDFTADTKYGFRLGEAGFRVFIEQYEKHVEDGAVSLRTRIRSEAKRLRDAILNEKPYQPEK